MSWCQGKTWHLRLCMSVRCPCKATAEVAMVYKARGSMQDSKHSRRNRQGKDIISFNCPGWPLIWNLTDKVRYSQAYRFKRSIAEGPLIKKPSMASVYVVKGFDRWGQVTLKSGWSGWGDQNQTAVLPNCTRWKVCWEALCNLCSMDYIPNIVGPDE